RSVANGLHCSVWDALDDEAGVRAQARAARLYMTAQVEAGHVCPMTMTNAAVAAIAHSPHIADTWVPRIRTRRYDPAQKPISDKPGALIGMGMTEKQGGSDVSSNA